MMKKALLNIALIALLLVAGPRAFAAKEYAAFNPVQTSPLDLELVAVGTVTEILKPDLIKLSNDSIYKIDNIRIPVRYHFAVTKFLEDNILNKKIGIYIVGKKPEARKNELGQILAHLMTEDSRWVQADVISRGLAWVDSDEKSRALVRPLYKFEELARAQRIGLWSELNYGIKQADPPEENLYNSFQVFEGIVRKVSSQRNLVFFNFGSDPNKDLTAVIKKESFPNFNVIVNSSGHFSPFNMRSLTGQYIRIRGWVTESGGPMIELTNPEQIEFPKLVDPPIP